MDLKVLEEVYTGARSAANTIVADKPVVEADTIKRLTPKHLKVIALHVAGWSNAEIGEIVGFSESYLPRIIHHPQLQELKQQLAEEVARETLLDARTVIQQHTMEAALKLVEHMRGEDEGISFRATQDVLDRGGIPKTEVLQAATLVLGVDEVKDLRTALNDIQAPVDEVKEVNESHTVLEKLREEGKLSEELSIPGGGNGTS